MPLRKCWAVARLEILGGLRRYALLGLVLLALALEMGGLFFMDFIPRDIGRASCDFVLTVGWFAGMLFLLFHAVQSVAWNDERRTIHTLLARPISRSEYVLGSYLGLALLLLLLNALLALLGYGVLHLIKVSLGDFTDSYFATFSINHYVLAWAGLFCIELMLLAVIVFFSGVIRGGFPVLLLSISYYFICTGLPVVRETVARRVAQAVSSEQLTVLFQGLAVVFPDFSRFDFKTIITNQTHAVAAQTIGLDCGLLCCFLVIVLGAACFIYQRRDLR